MTTAAMTEPAEPATPAPRLLGLRLLLVIAALFGAYDAYLGVTILFPDTTDTAGPGLGGLLMKAHMASQLLLTLATLLFAVIGRVRYAILALAAVVIMAWLNYISKAVGHGLDFGSMETLAQIIGFPLIAACAVVLAARNLELGIATLFVTVPTLFNSAGIGLFAIAVTIYGF